MVTVLWVNRVDQVVIVRVCNDTFRYWREAGKRSFRVAPVDSPFIALPLARNDAMARKMAKRELDG